MILRQIAIMFLFLTALQSCGTGREMNRANSGLTSDRITVLTILPKSDHGEIISALLVSHYENGKLALTGFFDRINSELTASDFVYVDSLEQLNFESLPLMWSAFKQDSLRTSEYLCSIGSRESVVKNHGTSPVFLSSLHANYSTIELPPIDSNSLSVQSIISSDCVVKEINGRKIRQESILYLGIVNKSEALFRKSSGIHYYWINAQLDNQEHFTLFFSLDSDNKIICLNATNGYIPKNSNGKIILNNGAEELEILMNETSAGNQLYRFESIRLTRSQQTVGHGICYML